MNEPWIAARSTLKIPYAWLHRTQTETQHLQALYDRLVASIRSVDKESLIFWEPACGSGATSGDGFDHVPARDPGKSVFSFHSYGPNFADPLGIEEAVDRALNLRERLGGAIMVCFVLHPPSRTCTLFPSPRPEPVAIPFMSGC